MEFQPSPSMAIFSSQWRAVPLSLFPLSIFFFILNTGTLVCPHKYHSLLSPNNLRCRLSAFLSSLPMAALNRWLRPEVYPLFAAVGVAVGICGMQLVRNITSNPEVRVLKEKRAAGILDNFEEGEKYAQHAVRKFVRNKSSQIMPSINSFFSDPN